MILLQSHLKVAIEAACGAGEVINSKRFSATAQEKRDGSIVTDADTAAETFIRDYFSKHDSAIPISGEEFGRDRAGAESEWIIDPIEGTTWYEMGSPTFGTLIGLLVAGEPVLSVIVLPATGEMVYASKRSGCSYTNPLLAQPVRTTVTSSSGKPLSQARVSSAELHRTDIWLEKGPKPYALSKMPTAANLFRLAGDSLQHALVARGKLDAAIDTAMHPWDTAAIVPCITEAGGWVCGIEGQRDNVVECASLLSASSRELLSELVETLRPAETVNAVHEAV